jgi:hypothetical protein
MTKLSRATTQRASSANNTVKLTSELRLRIAAAMSVEGFTVWSEFCRVALTEKCDSTEARLRARDPGEYERVRKTKAQGR